MQLGSLLAFDVSELSFERVCIWWAKMEKALLRKICRSSILVCVEKDGPDKMAQARDKLDKNNIKVF